MKLAYKAVDKSGKSSADSIEALSTAEAEEKLRQRGLFVTEIAPLGAEDRSVVAARTRRSGRAVKDLALWSRQMYVLVRSGTPLAQALEAIERQVRPGEWRDILIDIRSHVEEGISLSDSMALHPAIFDEVTRSLIAAGESSGQLAPMLDRVATLIRQQLRTQRTMRGALVYPALLTLVGTVVTIIMLVGVLPRFSALFDSLDAALPPVTQMLLYVSDFFRAYWWAIILTVVAGTVGVRMYLGSASGRRAVDQWAVRLPFVGPMVRSIATARISRLLGIMLESRVPMLEALELTRDSTTNLMYTEMMTEAVEAATCGEPISAVFARSDLINPSVTEAIRHGERNAQIGPILSDMADFLDEENEVIIKTAMSVLEPLILIVLGVVVGSIALSLFIPLFDLTSTAGAS
jgi:type II secretory pathway component PulF